MKQDTQRFGDDAERGTSFVFLGGNLALDLVNTEFSFGRGKRQDVLRTPHDASVWWNTAQAHYEETLQIPSSSLSSYESLQALQQLRMVLHHLFEAFVERHSLLPSDVIALNLVLQEGYPVLTIAGNGQPSSSYHVSQEGNPVLFTIALSAFYLLTQHESARLRVCQNPTCTLFFYDTTKSATRRWCSVGCKERARSVIRYRQTKQRILSESPSN